jgi:hypothetical protein
VASGKLSRRNVEDVLRRAAELEAGRLRRPGAAAEDEERDDLPEPEVLRLGQEAGISEDALRDALLELRTGTLTPSAGAPGDQIVISRTVPGPPPPVERAVGRFLREQLMTVRRHHGDRIEWQRARGLWPGLMRSVTFARRFAFAPVSRIETHVAAEGVGATQVTFRIDLGPWRRERLLRAAGRAAVAFGCFGLGGAWLFPGFGVADMLALFTGGGIAGGFLVLEQRRLQVSREEIAVAPERFLDLLVHKRKRALAGRTDHPALSLPASDREPNLDDD